MTLHLHNTRTQQKQPLEPITPGAVGIYVCGPTVQSAPHLGHLRSAVNYDLLRRWLIHNGLHVTFIRNITDIDDKILANATPQEPWWAVAHRVEKEFTRAYDALNILTPTAEPRATAHIIDIWRLIGELSEAGYAYPARDKSGDFYFSVQDWNEYGTLTRQNPDALPEEGDDGKKHDPRDFALWKGAKPTEPADASWPSPFRSMLGGELPGRPGWHIECSAMARHYLGAAYDIHGGGLDLRFPHHENELAQSLAAGDQSASIWTHNNLVTVNGEKMSKSLGNSIFALDALRSVRPIVLRYFLLTSHYRSIINVRTGEDGNLEEGSLVEADTAFSRLEEAFRSAERHLGQVTPGAVPSAFREAMDDDLNTPQAMAVLHDTARRLNQAATAGKRGDQSEAARLASELAGMLSVLGLHPQDDAWTTEETSTHASLSVLVAQLIKEREVARQVKDFATSDRIRNLLATAGVQVEDSPSGSSWRLQ